MHRLVLSLVIVAISGCATYDQPLTSTNSAELRFSRGRAPGGISGTFMSIDGKRMEASASTIRAPQGEHTIGYSCPDVISVDTQTVVTATFVAGMRYVLDCSANEPGVIRAE